MATNQRLSRTALAAAAAFAAGCHSPALLRTARTLPAGGHDVSTSFNVTLISKAPTGEGLAAEPATSAYWPNVLPDVLYAYGVTDDLELGIRMAIGLGLMEVSGKYRLLHAADGTLHVAVAPAAGYSGWLVGGPVLTLPLLVTQDLSPSVSLSGGALLAYTKGEAYLEEFGDSDLLGGIVYLGGGLGVELRPGDTFHVMPGVELQRSIHRSGAYEPYAPRIDRWFFSVTLGWGPLL